MKNIPFAKDLYIYTGSNFDGSIVIKDVHNEPFLISEGDEITFFIKNSFILNTIKSKYLK